MVSELSTFHAAEMFKQVKEVLTNYTVLGVYEHNTLARLQSGIYLPFRVSDPERQELMVKIQSEVIREVVQALPDKLFPSLSVQLQIPNQEVWEREQERCIHSCCTEFIEPIVRGSHVWSHLMMDALEAPPDVVLSSTPGARFAVAVVYLAVKFLGGEGFRYAFGWQGKLQQQTGGGEDPITLEMQLPSWQGT